MPCRIYVLREDVDLVPGSANADADVGHESTRVKYDRSSNSSST